MQNAKLFEDGSGAVFSPCRQYRYKLWRTWHSEKPFLNVIGLNPSTADETVDDPTIRRCIQFAKDWGYGGLIMSNLFAFRATLPSVMKAQADPIGIENDQWLQASAAQAGLVLAAWGNDGEYLNRGRTVAAMIRNLHCLGVTKSGQPKHPLYLPKTTVAVRLDDEWAGEK